MSYMLIAQRISEARREKGISQEELAELVEVTRQTVSRWETGEGAPNAEYVKKLCEVFSMSADELLFGVSEADGDKTSSPPQLYAEEAVSESSAEAMNAEEAVSAPLAEAAKEEDKRPKRGLRIFRNTILFGFLSLLALIFGTAIVVVVSAKLSEKGLETVYSISFGDIPLLILIVATIGFVFVVAVAIYFILKNRNK